VTFAAAVAHLYPFAGRLVLFLIPLTLLGIAECVEWVRSALGKRLSLASTGFAAVSLVPATMLILANPPVYRMGGMKPVLEYVKAHRQATEPIYVHYGAVWPVAYYGARFQVQNPTMGRCHLGQPRAYLDEMSQFFGEPRLWVLFTHRTPLQFDEELLTAYLDTIGRRLDRFVFDNGIPLARSTAYLYDLSDPTRLRATSPEDFELPAEIDASYARRFPCSAADAPPDVLERMGPAAGSR